MSFKDREEFATNPAGLIPRSISLVSGDIHVFKDREEFATNPAGLIPRSISLVNYEYMFTAVDDLPIYMRNSFILAISTAVIQVFVASLAGYAFARMRFPGRDLIFVALLISMFIPRSGGLMALYELMALWEFRKCWPVPINPRCRRLSVDCLRAKQPTLRCYCSPVCP